MKIIRENRLPRRPWRRTCHGREGEYGKEYYSLWIIWVLQDSSKSLVLLQFPRATKVAKAKSGFLAGAEGRNGKIECGVPLSLPHQHKAYLSLRAIFCNIILNTIIQINPYCPEFRLVHSLRYTIMNRSIYKTAMRSNSVHHGNWTNPKAKDENQKRKETGNRINQSTAKKIKR